MTLRQRGALKIKEYWDEEHGEMLRKLTHPTTGISDEYLGGTWETNSNRFWEEHGDEVQSLLHNTEFMEWRKELEDECRKECRASVERYYKKLAKARDAVKKYKGAAWTTTSAWSSE